MNDRLPPLTALRAFEAAARHMSFARAADELHVTPAALGFQIRSLEAHLGQPVFRRLNRAVELTAAGRALLPGTRDGFEALNAAWRAARRQGRPDALTVTAGPAFTAKWLAARLFDFSSAHPEINLRFVASLRLFDLDRDEVDLAIRFGRDTPDAAQGDPLVKEWMTPMMAPALATRMRAPADLIGQTLFHEDDLGFLDPPCDWPAWFRANGLDPAAALAGPRFSQADHAIDAAIAGGGIVLGRGSLCALALRAGVLCAPFEVALCPNAGYRVLTAPSAQARTDVRAFRDWLAQETALIAELGARHAMVAPSAG